MNERKINGRSPWSPRLPSSPPRKKPVAGIFCALRRLFFATKSFGRRGKNYDGEDFDCADGGFLLRVVDAGRNGLRAGLNERRVDKVGAEGKLFYGVDAEKK